MKKTTLILICLFYSLGRVHAQYNINQNKVWAFGHGAGVSFSSGTPAPILTSIYADEGSASVADSSGNLLFYTDGQNVWDKTNTPMTGSIGYNTNSSTQAALIIPVIGNSSQYYVVSTEQMEDYRAGDTSAPAQYYGIVDMSLNGGLGDIVSGSAKLLCTKATEKQIAINGNSNDIWLLTHRRDTSLFYAYHITTAGLDTIPVISNTGTMTGSGSYGAGVMKSSPNRLKVVAQNYETDSDISDGKPVYSQMGTEIYDFDPATGILSNSKRIDTGDFEYGAEFSPDNSKLYTMSFSLGGYQISQYDLSLSTVAAINASRVIIMTGYGNSDMKLAPDDKIYLNSLDSSFNYLDCITSPNTAGVACNYTSDAVHLLSGSQGHYGLPNVVVYPRTYEIISSLGVNTTGLTEDKIIIAPNPAQKELNIKASFAISNVVISDVSGQSVFTQMYHTNQVSVDISYLAAGVYFVRINGSEVRKFIKE